jgi:hypothetical protein
MCSVPGTVSVSATSATTFDVTVYTAASTMGKRDPFSFFALAVLMGHGYDRVPCSAADKIGAPPVRTPVPALLVCISAVGSLLLRKRRWPYSIRNLHPHGDGCGWRPKPVDFAHADGTVTGRRTDSGGVISVGTREK